MYNVWISTYSRLLISSLPTVRKETIKVLQITKVCRWWLQQSTQVTTFSCNLQKCLHLKNMPLPTLSKFSLSRAACNHSKPNSAVVEYMHLSKTWKFLVEKLENHICLDYKSLQLCVVPISRNLIRHIICSLSISLFFKIEKRIKIYKNFREKNKT